MAEAAAAQRFGHAHVVEAGLCRLAPHLADQALERIGEAPVFAVETPRILEQVAVPDVQRQDLLARKIKQAIPHGADVFGQFPGYGRQKTPPDRTEGHCWHGPCGGPVLPT